MAMSPHHRKSTRTPSPTPSEQDALEGRSFRLSDLLDPRNWKLILIVTFFVVLPILLVVYQYRLVKALRPAATWMHDTPGGWLIPIAILIVMSFPPLLGHEVVIILAGFTWGLGFGFAITLAGTCIGEVVTFFTFKYLCQARAEKVEQTIIRYGTLARVIREGGLIVAIIARFSAIPGHLLTAIFATCGMSFRHFTIGVIIALPRQLIPVYFGYALSRTDANGDKPKALGIVKWVFIAIIVATTLFAMRYIEKKEAAVRPDIIQQRRKRRQVESQEMVDNGVLPSLHRRNDRSRDTSTVELGLLNAPTPTRSTANVMHSHNTHMTDAARSSA